MSNLIIDYDLSVQPATDRDTRIRDAAPEMYELIRLVADLKGVHYEHYYNKLTGLVKRLDYVTDLATALLAKIEGGAE